MSPSETVRAMLDEQGIEWKSEANCDTYWYGQNGTFYRFTEHSDGATSFSTCQWDLTPKQTLTTPVAATVGNRTDLSKRLRKVHGLHDFAELFGFSWTDGSDWSWHDVACAMADAVDQQDEVERLKAENAKLRAERNEWHRVAVSKQDIIDHMRDARAENDKLRERYYAYEYKMDGLVSRLTGGLLSKSAATPNDVLYSTAEESLTKRLQSENAKLRELVRMAWKCAHSGLSCSDCRMVAGGCTLQSAMRELGVEADA